MTESSLIGQILSGYRIVKTIGEGGMGTVYLAEHETIGKKVAIKVLQEHFAHMPDVLARFIREAKAVNDIRHENVIEILGFDHTEDKEPYILMEYLEGQTLSMSLEKEVPFSTERTAHVGLQICSALFAAHEQGIIHRDLKGDNIFLIKKRSKKDFVKLIDFGIAKLMNNDLSGVGHTRTGAFVGTPICTAPEQADGRPVDARTDIYALGVLLHQMAIGAPPFYDKNPHLLIALHLTAQLPPPRSKNPNVHPGLEEVISTCLEKKQEDRFGSMKEVAEELAKLSKKSLSDYYFPEETRQVKIDLPTEAPQPLPSASVDIMVSQATQITPAPEGLIFYNEQEPIAKATTDSIPAGEAVLPIPKKQNKNIWKFAALAASLALGLAYGLILTSGPQKTSDPQKASIPPSKNIALPAAEPKPLEVEAPKSAPVVTPPIETDTKTTKNPSTKPKGPLKPKTPVTPTEEPPKDSIFKPKIPFNTPK